MKRQNRRASDGVRWIVNTRGINPKLGARLSTDGQTESLFLEFYNGGGKRERQTLKGLKLYVNPNPTQKAHNQNTEQAARQKQSEAVDKLLRGEGYMVTRKTLCVPFVDTLRKMIETTAKEKTGQSYRRAAALRLLLKFLTETGRTALQSTEVTKDIAKAFSKYMDDTRARQTHDVYFIELAKASEALVKTNILKENVFKGVKSSKPRNNTIEKAVLSVEELKTLADTHFKGEKDTIRRAFLFTCLSGVRHCDIKALKWSNIDLKGGVLTFVQKKVEHRSNKAKVTQYLNGQLLQLLGEPSGADEVIFKSLPNLENCNRYLQRWTKVANISKRITWHCGRHSYATMLLSGGVPLNVVSSNLGHSSIQITNVYIHTLEEQKKAATAVLPTIFKEE